MLPCRAYQACSASPGRAESQQWVRPSQVTEENQREPGQKSVLLLAVEFLRFTGEGSIVPTERPRGGAFVKVSLDADFTEVGAGNGDEANKLPSVALMATSLKHQGGGFSNGVLISPAAGM